jgi:hypothetical protein
MRGASDAIGITEDEWEAAAMRGASDAQACASGLSPPRGPTRAAAFLAAPAATDAARTTASRATSRRASRIRIPTAANLPAAHVAQRTAPAPGACFPCGHEAHDGAPARAL